MSFILTFLLMFAFWMLLSGHFDFILVTLGVISSLLVAYWSHDLIFGKVNFGQGLMRILRLIRYLPWLLWQIVLANFHLVYLTLHPKMPIEPAFLTIKTDFKTDMGVAIFANSITLTPGTVTLEAGRKQFVVHAISKYTAEGLLSGDMEARVKEIEGQ
ncbi:MAG: Na+/H+ antiporter subunit E [Eubacteriales bacterium]|nr:Na+/H+ antiporter subunit E [Bacillota bacterium]MBV1727698.1 Na+/H+ antiporter subunit E [Desulforudis sp.]MDQ7788519.1 Na+/H+ antiporter subunit E [Clostridia bacterium]MDZ4042014.1 Na+/H+ antiporter subunit E [Eubacteriales bacterium]MBU4532760.1 Na+/H+ antiporter subunit E [Bacillota bacterium]